jgi:hypothetical protein
LFSDRIASLFPTYELDEELRVIPTKASPLLNFNQLKENLLSKDIAKDAGLAKEFYFLDG